MTHHFVPPVYCFENSTAVSLDIPQFRLFLIQNPCSKALRSSLSPKSEFDPPTQIYQLNLLAPNNKAYNHHLSMVNIIILVLWSYYAVSIGILFSFDTINPEVTSIVIT